MKGRREESRQERGRGTASGLAVALSLRGPPGYPIACTRPSCFDEQQHGNILFDALPPPPPLLDPLTATLFHMAIVHDRAEPK